MLFNELFVAGSALFFLIFLGWGVRSLHREEWQFLASVSTTRRSDGSWEGINLTYYGLFNALAHVFSAIFLLVLTGAVGVPTADALLILLMLMVVCLPASRLIAELVEKKKNTFTVGGAAFAGIVLAPGAVWLYYRLAGDPSFGLVTPVLAAMSIAYAVGEGVGRLACISFGCCYGKPPR